MTTAGADSITALAAISDRLNLFMILTAVFVLPTLTGLLIGLARLNGAVQRAKLVAQQAAFQAEAQQDLGMQALLKTTLSLVGDSVASIRASTDANIALRDSLKADIGQVPRLAANQIVPNIVNRVDTLAQRNYDMDLNISKALDTLMSETRASFTQLPETMRQALAPAIQILTTIEQGVISSKSQLDQTQQNYDKMSAALRTSLSEINVSMMRLVAQGTTAVVSSEKPDEQQKEPPAAG